MTGAVPHDLPDWLTEARRIVVLTGAGISTESGIPDYRGPDGVWTKDPDAEKLVTLSYYLADPEIRRRSWLLRQAMQEADPQPNAGHRALVDLERQGRLQALVTQNIDGLHQAAGSGPGLVHEIHGTVHEVVCTDCGDRTSIREALDRVGGGEPDPGCRRCGGILKTATVYFGQLLDERVVEACTAAAADCDVFLAVGTSLQVWPAAGLADIAVRAGARLVVVNGEPTPYDDVADLVVREPIGTSLPRLVGA
ncbi:SIR2 family NAD-dependent protein deacylase [Blastococcus haudaquaticus]|uniref:protein acetyllysine N-acetyltransferase n=1 Tax=Blastococcus haudaquaticus TaxID=1938745 RepID=A0A286GTC3_9ACTN|nr:Sir2 family NAD-dependent protein deacetylase [Blastococcus haudaquaticus]SOD98811.1 NAD-dependent deacetylase [Blastococcus haudaquaticus]